MLLNSHEILILIKNTRDNNTNRTTNHTSSTVYTMILKQNATGSITVLWGSQYKCQSGIAPVLTTTAHAVDILTFISDGTNLYGLVAKDFR